MAHQPCTRHPSPVIRSRQRCRRLPGRRHRPAIVMRLAPNGASGPDPRVQSRQGGSYNAGRSVRIRSIDARPPRPAARRAHARRRPDRAVRSARRGRPLGGQGRHAASRARVPARSRSRQPRRRSAPPRCVAHTERRLAARRIGIHGRAGPVGRPRHTRQPQPASAVLPADVRGSDRTACRTRARGAPSAAPCGDRGRTCPAP